MISVVLIAGFILVCAAATYVLWVRIALSLRPAKGPDFRRFKRSNDQGNFGEILTAVVLTQRGWRQLPSKLGGGGQGIDGLFVRRGLLGAAVLISETKTNASPYKPRQLEAAKLIDDIGELYLIGALDFKTSDAIVRALKRRAPSIRKECWRHYLDSGKTVIHRAGHDGMLARRTRTRDHLLLVESLAMMLVTFDREGKHLTAK
jgi:hypothetical protein